MEIKEGYQYLFAFQMANLVTMQGDPKTLPL